MGKRQLKFLEFVPLILYFTFARAAGDEYAGRPWEISFVVGGVASTATLMVLMRNKTYTLNRIMLGADLFLVSGALAVLLSLDPLLGLYWRFNPAPMFAWVLVVGIAASLFSPHGFVGAPHSDDKRKRQDSALLLFAAVIALGFSLFFQGRLFYADILPFMGLFIISDQLQSRTPQSPGR